VVEVRGARQSDGSVVAREVQVSIPAPREETRREENRREDDRRGEGRERDAPQPERAPTATPLPEIQIEGTIEQISLTQWLVAGRRVRLTVATRVEGEAGVGSTARVNGTLQADGSILASSIRVQARRERTREDEEEERNRQGNRDRQSAPRATSTPERGREDRGNQDREGQPGNSGNSGQGRGRD
jgi:hypothetical protein